MKEIKKSFADTVDNSKREFLVRVGDEVYFPVPESVCHESIVS